MAMDVGNLLGAAANITSLLSKEKGLKSFLETFDDFGAQVTNNFEVNFSGLEDITFYIQTIQFAGMKGNTTTLHYDGRSIPIPINYDYEHEGNMTLINDGQGYLYSAVNSFIMSDMSNKLAKSGYTMIIKSLTGNNKYKGAMITLNNVRLVSIDGQQFDYSGGDVAKFTVQFQYIDFTYTPGVLADIANVTGAVNKLIG